MLLLSCKLSSVFKNLFINMKFIGSKEANNSSFGRGMLILGISILWLQPDRGRIEFSSLGLNRVWHEWPNDLGSHMLDYFRDTFIAQPCNIHDVGSYINP